MEQDRLSVSSLLSWKTRPTHHSTRGQSLWPGPPSHSILWDYMTCVVALEGYLRNLASMTPTSITSDTQTLHGLLQALQNNLPSKPIVTASILSTWLFGRLCQRILLAQNSVQLFGNSFKRSPLTAYVILPSFTDIITRFLDSRHLFGTELSVGQLSLFTLKVPLDPGLLMSQNTSKPTFTFQTTWSVKCHILLLSSPRLSSALFTISGFLPSSALIDAPDYYGTHPRIQAQSQLRILCNLPLPLRHLRGPVSSLTMGSKVEQLLLILMTTTTTFLNQLPILIDMNVLSPIALHLNHVQSHLPSVAPNLTPRAPPKGPSQRHEPLINLFLHWELHHATSRLPQYLKPDHLSLP